MPRAKPRRRTVVLAATACAGVLAVVLAVTAFSGGGTATGVSYLAGNTNAVYYQPGHRHVAPDFSGTTLTGQALRFASYRGRVVVLNFWGSWCVPCRTEAATLTVAANQYQRSGVEFLGVDIQDNVASAAAFARGHAVPYPSVSDPNDLVPLAFGSAVPIAATPTTLVVDASGHIAGAVFGEVTYSELSTLLGKVAAR
ncbi:MAG TPA: TlpA disulfide reductase family protein [Streptosporangiaceae bacterium]|nr:TlpA disulfide reductase family protein [Streptosporangiaceae bacterium]